MPISQARTIAFDVLLRVAKQDAYADDVLRAELNESVKTEDAGLATELSLGVLRWQRLLDFVIDRYLKTSAGTADIEVRIALRLGVYQLLFLDRVPARAAVHESVELVKRARKRSAATLVNAILRKAAKETLPGNSTADAVARLFPADLPLADRIGIQYSHPTWLVERWIRIYGEDRTRSLVQANNRVPALSGICSTRNVARKQRRRSNGLDAASNRDDCCATPGFSKEETLLRAKLCAAVG